MLREKARQEMLSGKQTSTISIAEYNKKGCIHRTLIHDYEKRSENGELARLREIFDRSTLNFELKGRKIDINLEDEKIDLKALESLWELADDVHKPISN